MQIYELRKTVSRNKKHKYVYQLIVNDEVVATRNSNKEYVGCVVNGQGKPGHYFTIPALMSMNVKLKLHDTLAVTFDGLVKLSNFGK